MNKGQSIFAGTFLVAAFLLHMGGGSPNVSRTSSPESPQTASSLFQGTPVMSASPTDGPWRASCRYWAPSKSQNAAHAPNIRPDSARVRIALQRDKAKIEVSEDPSGREDDPECGSGTDDRWGIPHPVSQEDESPQISTAIAILADPVHTHLSLEFDRTVQVLFQAAADNGYLSSYYWLPWRANEGSEKAEGSSSSGLSPATAREHQPGLIILKHNADPEADVSLSSSYYKVMYIFLVAETPTEGIDGFQLQNALFYERQVLNTAGQSGESASRTSNATIIGPTYSGSAASLRVAIEKACPITEPHCPAEFAVFGATETLLSVKELMTPRQNRPSRVNYFSFAANVHYTMEEFLKQTVASGYDPAQIAVLSEDDTVYGSNGVAYGGRMDRIVRSEKRAYKRMEADPDFDPDGKVLYMHFPREISVLRNTPVDSDSSLGSSRNVPSPYLRFSMRDSSGQDSVVQLSPEHSPLSQESQLMAIARELNGRRIKVVAISASDPLDEMFLARFFRRTCPNARQVFVQSDLLVARDGDVLPYVGSITVSPYSFMTKLFRTPGIGGARIYTDTASEAYYNAASFALWRQRNARNSASQPSNSTTSPRVPLEGYRFVSDKTDLLRPPALWVTTLGSDGYYPLGLIHPCSSDPEPEKGYDRFFPQVRGDDRKPPVALDRSCDLGQADSGTQLPISRDLLPAIYPAFQWEALCAIVAVLCLLHGLLIHSAHYDSPLTHDLDWRNNDQPYRRSMYIRFSTSMLFSMTTVLVIPLMALESIVPFSGVSIIESVLTLLCGLFALRAGFSVTRRCNNMHGNGTHAQETLPMLNKWVSKAHSWSSANVYSMFNAIAWSTVVLIPALWTYICLSNTHYNTALRRLKYSDFAGLCFAFRCLHPFNGVSPLLPVLLLLFGWYIWGLFQTWRMCFSNSKRPRLPQNVEGSSNVRLFVSDDDLESPGDPNNFGLYKRLGCLLITRKLIQWLLNSQRTGLDLTIAAVYTGILGWFSFASPYKSIDHLMWSVGNWRSCPYDTLLGLLFFPLFWCSFSGWLRLILVWASLKKELLDPLENMPIRFAFSKLQGKGWMTVLSRVGVEEQRRDLDRCVESMRQMLHLPDLKSKLTKDLRRRLDRAGRPFLHNNLQSIDRKSGQPHNFTNTEQLEKDMAAFSEELLSCVLIPFWENERTGLVESDSAESLSLKSTRSEYDTDTSSFPIELRAGHASESPRRIVAAEEFLAMRYMTLIRAVLYNMRCMMVFFSVTFVLTIVAWNSYPFQPRETGDWLFSSLLTVLSLGIIWVFAQMHRDPILSRVAGTPPNELGWSFCMRVISFGAIPVLTWLAYQFPEVGSMIYNLIQPGSSMFK